MIRTKVPTFIRLWSLVRLGCVCTWRSLTLTPCGRGEHTFKSEATSHGVPLVFCTCCGATL